MRDILAGQFFWGIVVGLILSVVGGWFLAYFNARQTKVRQQDIMRRFCSDIVQNVKKIARDLDETRDRGSVIHHDFLSLLDVEMGVFGRNREHLIHLNDEGREAMRDYMTTLAVRRARIAKALDDFYKVIENARQLTANGHLAEAAQTEQLAEQHLAEAHAAADKLTAFAVQEAEIVRKVNL